MRANLKAFAAEQSQLAKDHWVVVVVSAVLAVGGAFGVVIPTHKIWPALAIIFAALFGLELLVAYGFWKRSTSDVQVASRAIKDDFARIRNRLAQLEADLMRAYQFAQGDLADLPTGGVAELPRLEDVLSSADYAVVIGAYDTIDDFNAARPNVGVTMEGDEPAAQPLRRVLDQAEAVLP